MKVCLKVEYHPKKDRNIEASKLDEFLKRLYPLKNAVWRKSKNNGLEIIL